MTIIGLIGLIGAGKSTVGKLMSTKGCDVIDLDKISHHLYRKDTDTYNEILSIWGVDILDESLEIDRKKLANIIFPINDLSKSISEGSSKLEAIIWPKLESVIQKEILDKKKGSIKVIEGALILKAGFDRFCDSIWLVDSTVENIKKRNPLATRSDFANRLDTLIPLYSEEEIQDRVDEIIENNSTKQNLNNNVESLLERIRKGL